MSINLISKHRSELMAIAMLWIAIFHSYFPFTTKLLSFPLCACGYGGVDLFVFLSGFGIYYACKKETNYIVYIKRRLLKILPYNIPLCVVSSIINNHNAKDTIIDSLGLSIYFRNNLIGWYVSFILLMYIISPIYMKIFKKKPFVVTILSCGIVFVLCFYIYQELFSYIYLRAAVYFLGFYFAYLNENEKLKSSSCWLIVLAMLVGWFIIYYLYHYCGNGKEYIWPMFIIVPGMSLLLSWLTSKTKYLQKALKYIGNYTFPFYIIHLEVIKILYKYYDVLYIGGVGFDWWINIAGIVIAFIIAVIFKGIVDITMDVIINKARRLKA